MKRYKVTYLLEAEEEIAALAEDIAAHSSLAIAERYIRALIRECDSLSLAPWRGTKRSDLRPNMRVIGHKRAVAIAFRVEEAKKLVVILGIMYRGQSIDRILERIQQEQKPGT